MLLAVVEKHHRRRDRQDHWYWLDDRSRRYQIDLARHGLSQADRAGVKSYRFCFEVPPGFHYDVTHDYEREFTMDIDGRFQQVSHCNVTPWSHVRRG
jgi:hypothetical protein